MKSVIGPLIAVGVWDDCVVAVKRMDNVGIVVESLDAAIPFFEELGLNLEGRAMIEGDWAGRVTGLGHQRVEIAMMVIGLAEELDVPRPP